MRKYLDKAVNTIKETLGKSGELVSRPMEVVSGTIGKLPYVGALLVSDADEKQQFDEKHYFVIPFRATEVGYSLHSIRCLPSDVPPINDLPKKRFFHVPNENTDQLVKHLLLGQVDRSTDAEKSGIGDSLIDLADQIDRLDTKVTKGVLLIGGLVSLLNPLAGVGIAARAMIPGLASAASKFGLRAVGKAANTAQLNLEIRNAERDVLREFQGSATVKLINPIIRELEISLNTTEADHDTLLSFDFETAKFAGETDRHLLKLTCRALTNQYASVLADKDALLKASLRQNEVRWLELVSEIAKH